MLTNFFLQLEQRLQLLFLLPSHLFPNPKPGSAAVITGLIQQAPSPPRAFLGQQCVLLAHRGRCVSHTETHSPALKTWFR